MLVFTAKLTDTGYGADEEDDVLFDELADAGDLDEAIDDVRRL